MPPPGSGDLTQFGYCKHVGGGVDGFLLEFSVARERTVEMRWNRLELEVGATMEPA